MPFEKLKQKQKKKPSVSGKLNEFQNTDVCKYLKSCLAY